ncbi:hypothetical protein [Ralstonia insidiosa]|uniref:hypothetical protein n=1 Tax=Ralstonia insidiosa TaxID=190721 RepID=UPI001427E9B6|nr:hypothetical protein [Ralstonia insidiosa]
MRWTTTELAILVREYPRVRRVSVLGSLIPRHTLAGIYAKARRCGLEISRREAQA